MNLLTLQSFVSRFLQMTYNDFVAMQLAVKEYHATVDSNAILIPNSSFLECTEVKILQT